MWSQDIEGSEAYAKALQKTGIITEQETVEICKGLEKVRAEWAAGEFKAVVSSLRLYAPCSYNVGTILSWVKLEICAVRSKNSDNVFFSVPSAGEGPD